MGRQRTANPAFEQELEELETAFYQAEQQALDNPEEVEAITAVLLALVAAWVVANVPRIYVVGIEEALNTLLLPLAVSDVHDGIADNLGQDLLEALLGSVSELERQMRGRVREMERNTVAANLGAQEKELLPYFVDRGGRKWNFGGNATMLVRDATTDIHNTAVGMVAAEVSSPGVRISDGSSPETDEPCRIANGQHWSISYFLANTKQHPNCQRRGSLLPREWQGELDRE